MTALALSGSALAATSSGTETIYAGNYQSTAWQTNFDGSKYRDLNTNRVIIEVNHNNGGFDASFATKYSIDAVDKVSSNFKYNASFTVSGSGSGDYWAGPKISVNWVNGNSNGSAGWYENYIVDKASRSPQEMNDWLLNDYDSSNPENRYLGTTNHDGATYKHYVFYHKSWAQYWAVRQSYRNGGSTSIKPILNKWRDNGLPNKKVDGIKYNVETHKKNNRKFTITRKCMPTSFTDGSCANSTTSPGTDNGESDANSLSGNQRIKGGWKGRYLHASSKDNWANVKTLNLNSDWSSQKWIFEKVSGNVYRIKNRWTNKYLSAPSTNEWDTVKTATLNTSWSSQKWKVTKTGNQYRIQNEWSKLYLQENEKNDGNLQQAALRSDWGSMKWSLSGY